VDVFTEVFPSIRKLNNMRNTEVTKSLLKKLNAKERIEFRKVLRLSIGKNADEISEEELDDIAFTLLQATALALKRKATINITRRS